MGKPKDYDLYCPRCGAGFPIFQKVNIYDATYYGDDTDCSIRLYEQQKDDDNNYIGQHFRFYCPSCNYATPIYEESTEAREVWEKEHEKNYPNIVRQDIIDHIVSVLERTEGYNYPNALLAFGSQVANGISLYWKMYVGLIEGVAEECIATLPYDVKMALYDKADIEISLFSAQEDIEKTIIQDIFARVSDIAENAYYDFENE